MPTETFLRLPEEKRGRFLEAAWTEFTRVKFADVSINQIVRRAGIPRGSFYQYFTDKEELFFYLLEDVKAYVVQTFIQLLHQNEGDIFQLQLALYDNIAQNILGGRTCPPLLDRCFHLVQVNPGFDLKRLLGDLLQQEFPQELLEKIHVSALKQQDPAYVRRVFLLTLSVLGHVLADTLLHPERAPELRQEMVAMLEMIQYGCLRKEQAENT